MRACGKLLQVLKGKACCDVDWWGLKRVCSELEAGFKRMCSGLRYAALDASQVGTGGKRVEMGSLGGDQRVGEAEWVGIRDMVERREEVSVRRRARDATGICIGLRA